jgi:hypothetical protein
VTIIVSEDHIASIFIVEFILNTKHRLNVKSFKLKGKFKLYMEAEDKYFRSADFKHRKRKTASNLLLGIRNALEEYDGQ